MKQFSATITVTLPDSTKRDINTNLFDINAEFNCPVCDFIGDESKISLLSFSDHFARHYVENNRAEKIDEAIRLEQKEQKRAPAITRDELAQYDDYLNKELYYDIRKERFAPQELSEEDMLKLAIEESLRESEQSKTESTDLSVQTENGPNTLDLPTYQPRRKKVSDTTQ